MSVRMTGVVLLSTIALAACGGGTEPAADAPDEPTVPTENRVEIGMTEYAFGMPAEVAGGTVTLEFTNNGEVVHEAAFGAIEGDRDADDIVKALDSREEPEWLDDLAGIPVLDPGATASMTRDLDEGRYMFICFLPVPGKGAPHATEGMVQVFDVTADAGAEEPEVDATITATEDGFGFETPEFAAGTQTIELVNDGKKPHEFIIFSLEPGKTEKDIDKWFGSGFETDKPAAFPGGLQSIEPGTSVIVEMTFESGRTYLVRDFESDLTAEIEVS